MIRVEFKLIVSSLENGVDAKRKKTRGAISKRRPRRELEMSRKPLRPRTCGDVARKRNDVLRKFFARAVAERPRTIDGKGLSMG
jgi:hypothetical protein